MQPYQRIVILGGGTAGWMAALALVTSQRAVDVEVVEAAPTCSIGIGVASCAALREFHRMVGIDEADFLRATLGSYRLGTELRDWQHLGQRYFDMLAGMEPDGTAAQYAYQFDTQLYAGYLRRLAMLRGVHRNVGRLEQAIRRADGGISALQLSDGRNVSADLFIDCSGGDALLLGAELGVPFVDFSQWLPADAVWLCPAERSAATPAPCNIAVALDAGWAWQISLQHRSEHGYIYSRQHCDDAAARTRLLARLDGAALAEPRLQRLRSGHRSRFWLHNVVALGQAAGQLEPLEAPAVMLIQRALTDLLQVLASPAAAQAEAVAAYNRAQERLYCYERDRLILHYARSTRQDSQFWRDMGKLALPDALALRLQAWRECVNPPRHEAARLDGVSWGGIYAATGCVLRRCDPVLLELTREEALHAREARRVRLAALMELVQREYGQQHQLLA